MTDQWRSGSARRTREVTAATHVPASELVAPAADDDQAAAADDTLTLMFMCCHPSLTAASQVALTLRAVGGLTTDQIGRAFFAPEATMAQRISRAKARIKATGIPFRMPGADERDERLRVVLQVLYLIFNEGYTTASGPDLQRPDLTAEAIRLTREIHHLLPDEGEIAGLLALMLLTDARRAARTTSGGDLVPLAEQDRGLWNREFIEEGVALISRTLSRSTLGPYQLQAAIAAVHDEAPEAEDTGWDEILGLYEVLERMSANPMVTLNHAVAMAMVHGPQAGLEMIDRLELDGQLAGNHRLDAVKAHLLETGGDPAAAIERYRLAARRTTSLPERRYLETQAARLARDITSG
jgi:predicted RNA polymerase sigma factor